MTLQEQFQRRSGDEKTGVSSQAEDVLAWDRELRNELVARGGKALNPVCPVTSLMGPPSKSWLSSCHCCTSTARSPNSPAAIQPPSIL